MNIKKELISWSIFLSVGAVVGCVVGHVIYHYSQPHRVLVYQKTLFKEYMDPTHVNELTANAKDLVIHATNKKFCGKTILNEFDDVIASAEKEANACSANYTTTGTSSLEPQVPDIVSNYTDKLLEACK